jgi:4a-hydroxytetrahydrobiopterin dehydratase
MASSPPLNDTDLQAALQDLPGWSLDEGKLHKAFRFRDFQQAFAFMTRMALVSERMDHHPEWSNVYANVVIHLTSHSAGGITAKDVQWARAAEATCA